MLGFNPLASEAVAGQRKTITGTGAGTTGAATGDATGEREITSTGAGTIAAVIGEAEGRSFVALTGEGVGVIEPVTGSARGGTAELTVVNSGQILETAGGVGPNSTQRAGGGPNDTR